MDHMLYHYLNELANNVLPDLIKITVEVVIIPLIGLAARALVQWMVGHHMSLLVKWAGQKISRQTENWAEQRLKSVVEAAQKIWWLKWVNEEDLHKYIEAAVAEWNTECEMKLGSKR